MHRKCFVIISLLLFHSSCARNKNQVNDPSKADPAFCRQFNSPEKLDELIACLRTNPPENIRTDEKIDNYLKHHKVYVSVTTSPLRLKYLTSVLRTVDLELVSKIYVTLPKYFKNDEKQPYPEDQIEKIKNFPQVVI